MSLVAALVLSLLVLVSMAGADNPVVLPREWIDPDTGHRIIRLSDQPGTASLYFHENAYTPDGKKLLVTIPNGLATIDLETRRIDTVVEGKVKVIMSGYKTGRIYYTQDDHVYAADPGSGEISQIARIPRNGSVRTVNCDETLLAGTITEYPEGTDPNATPVDAEGRPLSKGARIAYRFNQKLPMSLFFIDVKSGETRTVNRCTDWLNHLQFSPTDPTLLMFCHEGPWEKVNRIWTIRSGGSDLKPIHQRTMTQEIFGHEWFAADGKTIWYDLQTPRGEVFWVAGYDLQTGRRTWYNLERDEWSVHFNSSPDGRLFAGDGGAEGMVARAKDGKWIYLFRPEILANRGEPEIAQSGFIVSGVFRAERLVNMARHDYSLEPNVTFTPDMKWIVFRSNMLGPTHVFAVEIAK